MFSRWMSLATVQYESIAQSKLSRVRYPGPRSRIASLKKRSAQGACYGLQNSRKESFNAATLENPRAETPAWMPPNCPASAEALFPVQFGSPGIPASGTVSPERENVMLNVGGVSGGVAPMMSVPIRTQSGARRELRIHACKSPVNGTPGDRGADM